jgi:small subunit ribosomal protein S11
MIKIKKTTNKKNKKNFIILVNLYIQATYKNTLISLTKSNGHVLKQWSTKSLKKTKFKKNTPYNVQLLIYKINKYIKIKKVQQMNIYFKGTGLGRRNIIRNLKIYQNHISIRYIFDKTPRSFNGCRKKKKKRR